MMDHTSADVFSLKETFLASLIRSCRTNVLGMVFDCRLRERLNSCTDWDIEGTHTHTHTFASGNLIKSNNTFTKQCAVHSTLDNSVSRPATWTRETTSVILTNWSTSKLHSTTVYVALKEIQLSGYYYKTVRALHNDRLWWASKGRSATVCHILFLQRMMTSYRRLIPAITSSIYSQVPSSLRQVMLETTLFTLE